MLLEVAAQRRVLFFGGKGGVGKTTVASAVALARAQAGSRVLLVSTDPAHNLGHLFDITIGDGVTQIAPGLDACELDPEQTMRTHLAAAERTIRRLMPEHLGHEVAKHLELARAAPGAAEAAVLERLADIVEGASQLYDLVVIDTAPSGHTVRLLAMPQIVSTWTDDLLRRQERSRRFEDAVSNLDQRTGEVDPGADLVPRATQPHRRRGRRGRVGQGPRAEEGSERNAEIREILLRRQARFTHLRSVITDEQGTGFVVVLAAERLPILETIDLHAHLRGIGADVSALVVNRRMPRDEGGVYAHRRQEEDRQLVVLRTALPGFELHEVPLLPSEPLGCDGLAAVIEHLR